MGRSLVNAAFVQGSTLIYLLVIPSGIPGKLLHSLFTPCQSGGFVFFQSSSKILVPRSFICEKLSLSLVTWVRDYI